MRYVRELTQDCHRNVASKFFSSTEAMAGPSGARFPLCETDYFRRLNLLCHQCGRALRGSYITALGAKYHVEHFTCSVCPTVFGPNDSYYEHKGHVYCHFHYSTRFAIQCAGCHTAILKQFVEINRNNADEHWHPECYMIHRYWKIKLGTPAPSAPLAIPLESVRQMPGGLAFSPMNTDEALSMEVMQLESIETPASLLAKQQSMETRVFTIWRVLSAYEESSAACISDMLRHVSNGKYLGGVQYAERFVVHVEVLFSAIDALEAQCTDAGARPIQYVREARMLCKKIVNFFSLFTRTQAAGAQRMGITQELLSLVTGLAHYLKILIRISLTSALRLGQEYDRPSALDTFLATLEKLVVHEADAAPPVYGYSSLPRMHDAVSEPLATDLCAVCAKTVEDGCLRSELLARWHWECARCAQCHRGVQRPDAAADGEGVPVHAMQYHRGRHALLCTACAPGGVRVAPVTRLEQYAFLLCIALNRLHTLLQTQDTPIATLAPLALTVEESGTYRKSVELKRMESAYLHRHTSSTAHQPHFATVVGGAHGHHTQVRDEAVPLRNPWTTPPPASGSDAPASVPSRVSSRLGSHRSGEEGITLADIPLILQAEQDREQLGGAVAAELHDRRPVSELTSAEMVVLKHLALARLQRSSLAALVQAENVQEFLEARRYTLWSKLFRAKDRRDGRKKGVFGVSLELLTDRNGADSTLGASPTPMRIPSFVEDIVSAMRQMDMSVEGIFRKNGNVRRLKELTEVIDRDQDELVLLDEHPVQLAALLKKFLRELPDPLMTARLYRLLIATQQLDEGERRELLNLVVLLLPRAHRDTLEVLFVFFKWVASFAHVDEETGSRMDLANLATVICPNILYSRTVEPSRSEAVLAIQLVASMLEHQDEFWFVPERMLPILQDRALIAGAAELSTPDLLKRCSKYVG